MISKPEQALAVQKRRVKAGKFGYAKAVRRACKRLNTSAKAEHMPVIWDKAA